MLEEIPLDATNPPLAKGAGFNSAVAVLRDGLLSTDEFATVVRKLPPATAEAIKTPPMPMEWIPVARYGDLVSHALAHAFRGDETKVVEMGRRALLYDLKTLYRVFIKLLSPGFVIDRAGRLWLTYNHNNGQVSARKVSDRRCEVSYEGVMAVYPGFWSYQRGCLLAAVQATGYKEATVVLSRPDGGKGSAMYTVDWG
jgi:hypothetical protein